jgi:hypothetical protein
VTTAARPPLSKLYFTARPTSGDALGCGVKIVCWFSVAHIVQLLCSAPASETIEGEREGVEGGRMQDARQRRRVPTADMRREDQAVGLSHGICSRRACRWLGCARTGPKSRKVS